MSATSIYKTASIFLLLINVMLIGFIWIGRPGAQQMRPPDQRPKGDGSFMLKGQKLMNLDEEQMAIYKERAIAHNKALSPIDRSHKECLLRYFQNQDSLLLEKILDLEKQKIRITDQHFEEIKSLLREDQVAGFAQFKKEALNRILLRRRPNRPPGPR